MARVSLLCWLLVVSSATAAEADGPYVLRDAAGWEAVSVEVSAAGARPRVQKLAAGATVTVPAVGAVPAFVVPLRDAPQVSPDAIKASSKAPLFVIADTHGEFEILVAQLQKHGIVDANLKWTFGRGRLVVLGDVFDRGPNHTEILWLLYKLEAEAQKGGGGLHLVLGNHEAMVMNGDLRYLHPRYLETARVFGLRSYSQLFGTETLLGRWLRTRPTVLKIDDQLFLHAGVSRALADSGMTLAEINASVRALLSGSLPVTAAERERAELLMGSLGPLWYRGYFASQAGSFPIASTDDVERVLAVYGVRRIFVGHTIVPAITPLYDGKVIAVQVYPRRDAAGNTSFESLLVKSGAMWRAGVDGGLSRLEPAASP
jgi:hypothetical protein